jgi:hypothetical protein
MGWIGKRLIKRESEGREKNSKGNLLLVYVISYLQVECAAFLALITVHLFFISYFRSLSLNTSIYVS